MKRLTIRYGDMVLFDADVAELAWTDSENAVKVEGKLRQSHPLGGVADMLTGLSKQKTQAQRAELSARMNGA